MSAAAKSPPPGALTEVLRPKTLPLSADHLDRTKGLSPQRAEGRRDSRAIVRVEMKRARAVELDVADGLGVSARVVSRILAVATGDDDTPASPFDLGDLLAIARTGIGAARLARAIHDGIGEELVRILRKHETG